MHATLANGLERLNIDTSSDYSKRIMRQTKELCTKQLTQEKQKAKRYNIIICISLYTITSVPQDCGKSRESQLCFKKYDQAKQEIHLAYSRIVVYRGCWVPHFPWSAIKTMKSKRYVRLLFVEYTSSSCTTHLMMAAVLFLFIQTHAFYKVLVMKVDFGGSWIVIRYMYLYHTIIDEVTWPRTQKNPHPPSLSFFFNHNSYYPRFDSSH